MPGVEQYRWPGLAGGAESVAGSPVVGAIDLGTNNCRLLVARLEPGGFKVVDAFSRIVRLGEGLGRSGELSPAAMTRCVAALRICAEKLQRRQAGHLRAVATEACRKASNRDAFLLQAQRETGITLEVISQQEEVRLAADGCAPLVEEGCSDALIFDIGGGSTEISWVKVEHGSRLSQDAPARLVVRDCCSLPIGVVNMAERYGGRDVSPQSFQAMVAETRLAAMPFEERHGLAAALHEGQLQVIGTSGTVTTLAGLSMNLERYDRNRVDGVHLTMEQMSRLNNEIASMSYQERRRNACIGEDRADLVVAGCAILEGLLQLWPAPKLRVADRGLREGILLQFQRHLLGSQSNNGAQPTLRDRSA